MFDGKKYENMLSHDYRKYLINGGNIKLKHLKEDKIFLKFYNDVKLKNCLVTLFLSIILLHIDRYKIILHELK
jgi:hypothetical protein